MKGTPEKHPEFDSETYTNPILEECYGTEKNMSRTMIRPSVYR